MREHDGGARGEGGTRGARGGVKAKFCEKDSKVVACALVEWQAVITGEPLEPRVAAASGLFQAEAL